MSAVVPTEVEVRPSGRAATDSSQILVAATEAMRFGCPLILTRGPSDPAFQIDAPIVLKSATGRTSIKLDVICQAPDQWPVIEYSGTPNTPAIRTEGLKRSWWQGLTVRLLTPKTTAFEILTSGAAQSSSGNTFTQCDVQLQADGTQGWHVGPDGPGGADLSGMVWDNCIVAGVKGTNPLAGWVVTGGNTLNLHWRDCSVNYLAGYGWNFWGDPRYLPADAGGAASLLSNCGGSNCQGLVRLASGLELTVLAGRSENMTGAVLWSGPGSAKGKFVAINHKTGNCPVPTKQDGATPVLVI